MTRYSSDEVLKVVNQSNRKIYHTQVPGPQNPVMSCMDLGTVGNINNLHKTIARTKLHLVEHYFVLDEVSATSILRIGIHTTSTA
jgi:hypothetical protein